MQTIEETPTLDAIIINCRCKDCIQCVVTDNGFYRCIIGYDPLHDGRAIMVATWADNYCKLGVKRHDT